MIAAAAAAMASVSMADISIKGDAYVAYSDKAIGVTGSDTTNRKRVNLNVTGKSGASKVVVSLRVDDKAENVRSNSSATNVGLHTHQFYITTKAGPVNIKAGDFYGTVGLGAWTKSTSKTDAVSLSTKIGPVKLGMFTAENGTPGTTNVSIAGKIAGATVKFVSNPNAKWTDLSLKGTFNGILVAAESFKRKAKGSKAKETISLVHVGGKVGGVKWDVAQYKNEDARASSGSNNAKFAPLGSMLVGKSARGGTETAAANIGQFSKILGVAVSTKLAGNTIKAIFAKDTLGKGDKLTGTELILTRSMSGGKLTANLGKVSGSDDSKLNATNKGLRFDVKF